MNTIHIIAHQHTEDIKEMLLNQNDALAHTQVLPFNIAFGMDYDKAESLVLAYAIVSDLDLRVLLNSAKNPVNLESYLSLIEELKLYNVDPSDLPNRSELQKDNKDVITALFHLIPEPKISASTRYVVYDHFLSHASKHFLINNKIDISPLETTEASKTYLKSLNIRHEFESALQNIINENISEVTFVVPSLKDKIPLIESILLRYGFNMPLENRQPKILANKYLSLFNLASNPSQENLIKAINNHAFNINKTLDIIYLIQHFDLSWNLPESLESPHLDVKCIINRSQDSYNTLKEKVEVLLSARSLQEKLITSYSILSESPYIDTTFLKKILESQLHLYDKSNIHLLIHQLQSISATKVNNEYFTFYDLNDFPIHPQENVIAIDMNSKNYPAIGPNTGLLDDTYRSQIKGYPSLQDRTNHILNLKNTFIKKSKNLTLSYSITNYEGKSLEPSFEIFKDASKILAAPMNQKTSPIRSNWKLDPSFVAPLFMENGNIRASVTSLEKYGREPLEFFIENGLKYRKPLYPVFGPMNLGNYNHDLLEQHHRGAVKDFNEAQLFPDNNIRLKMILARNNKLMEQNFKFIDESITASTFEPQYAEYEFEENTLFPNFHIRGKVDRVDVYNDSFLIYDYKSSETILNRNKIQDGQQLQLLTYGFILEKKLSKSLFGVYYYGLRSANLNMKSYSYAPTKGLTEIETNTYDLWLSEKRYKGFLFQRVDGQFLDKSYHQRLKTEKDGSVSLFGKPFDKQLIHQIIREVYQRIYKSITDGNFDLYQVQSNLKATSYVKLEEVE